jgi:hypothetical protein
MCLFFTGLVIDWLTYAQIMTTYTCPSVFIFPPLNHSDGNPLIIPTKEFVSEFPWHLYAHKFSVRFSCYISHQTYPTDEEPVCLSAILPEKPLFNSWFGPYAFALGSGKEYFCFFATTGQACSCQCGCGDSRGSGCNWECEARYSPDPRLHCWRPGPRELPLVLGIPPNNPDMELRSSCRRKPLSVKDEHGWELQFPLRPNDMYARKRSATPEKMTVDRMECLGAPGLGSWALEV